MSDLSDQLAESLIREYGFKEAQSRLCKMAGYLDVPPTVDEFFDDPYFAGGFLGNSLYPTWRNVLREIFPHPFYSNKLEIAATGSIGCGKSTFCLAGMLYDLCRLLYLKNPHETFQLVESTPITIAFINSTLTLAQAVLFNQFQDWVNESPFFLEQRARVRNKKDFLPHRINLMNGSRGSHAYGRGVVMAILSELNYQGQAVKDQATQNYVHVKRRMESRFGRGEGFIAPGRLWLDSSKSDETGFLEQYLKNIHHDENALLVSKAIWEILGDCGKVSYSGKTFMVFIGDQNRDPFILEGPGASIGIPEGLTISVPVEYRRLFESDIYGSLRDLAGVSTWSSHKFIPQEASVRQAMSLENPVTKEIIALDFDNTDDQLINYIDVGSIPRGVPYFIHFDIGITKDRTGIAMSRSLGEVSVERTSSDLVHALTRDFTFETNMVMAVIAKPGKEVPLSKLKKLVAALTCEGIAIAGVSADGYQSADLLQSMRELGISDELISTDRTRDAYDHFKGALLERRWIGPNHSILRKELLGLQDQGKKIDHPVDGGVSADRPSKDISDAVAGSVYNCKQNSIGGKALAALGQYTKHVTAKRNDPVGRDHLLKLALQNKMKRKGAWKLL